MFDFPNSPGTGQTVTNGSATYRFDGTKWTVAGGSGGGASITVSDTPPPSPTPGALWWDSVGGNLYLWYQDPNSSEWVIANQGGIADAPTDGNQYARQNQSWTNISAVSAAAPNNTGRNLVHNGQFNVQQRGAGPWTANANLTADRWKIALGTDSNSVSVVTLTDTDRAQIGDEAARYGLQDVVAGNAAGYSSLQHNMEGVRRFSGKTVTVSFWAKANTGTPSVGVSFTQNYGTGGSPSSPVDYNGIAVTIGTTWARYSVTLSVASAAGKTLGTNGDDQLILFIWFSSQASMTARTGVGVQSNTFMLWGVQLEIGSVATPLAKRDPADELALCQRFYQWIVSPAAAGYSTSGTVIQQWYPFAVQMRAAPSLTPTWGTNTNLSPTAGSPTTSGFLVSGSSTGTGQWGFNLNTLAASADL